MTPLGARSRATAAVLLLLLALAAVVELVVMPLAGAFERRSEAIRELEGQIASLQRITAGRADSERRLERLAQRADVEGLAFREPNASGAAAALQQQIGDRIAAAGAKLVSIQVLPGVQDGDAFRMTARVTFNASPQSLPAVLHGLESNVPYLLLDKLSLSSRGFGYGAAAASRTPKLTVRLEVSGFLAPGAPVDGG